MALTRKFKETVKAMADANPEFRRELLIEAINLFINGEVDLGRETLKDYINATVSLSAVAKELDKNVKSIQRMLGKHGNPGIETFFKIVIFLQKNEGVHFEIVDKGSITKAA
ncbi:hypothetical protein PsalMR5_04526 (plasmid) [Piscirickettsia salmonis]|uniref:transcriptional regulator n=1 Tax=Piscirickettsia salmonis TaxID=1238 RepID=UPI0012BAC861|nr:transcriptional regulator [Piscirickettsia salmonis]QGP56995.1 hypothetical protein PsalSR1_04484 [Piscirickettsia salmonis]QGP61763.1 hypothetical protein PsalBI1_04405 [Piscirickettsia salmonis]QGP66601.1 hypothetical protein PsalMR5_04526 [Piscirickettsia salmonis]